MPPLVTDDVRRLCRSIGLANDPVFIPVEPDPLALTGECFYNVRRKVDDEGGAIRFGWAIWQCGDFFIEAEHHAVFQTPEATLIDITPHADGETRILFLRDDSARYDFGRNKQKDNQRLALLNRPEMKRYLALAAKRTRLMNSVPVIDGRVTFDGEKAIEMQSILREMVEIEMKLSKRS